MTCRVRVDDFYLREWYGIKQYATLRVFGLSHDGVENRYGVYAKHLYDSNIKGQIRIIWLKEYEITIKGKTI